MNKKVKFKSLELFAGAGGLALGLEKAGFKHIALVEYDKHASETLRMNRPKWKVVEQDISQITKSNLNELFDLKSGDLDLISGGFPCQSFSYAGKGGGLEDARGTLFFHYAEFIKQLKPKMFLAENVKGLTSHDNGKTFQLITEVLIGLGYRIYHKVLNAWDYDVAQKRERIFIVGIREDLDYVHFQFPFASNYKPVLRDVIKDVPNSPGMTYSDSKRKIMELIPPGGSWVNLPEELQKSYLGGSYHLGGGKRGIARRISWDEPSLTLTTSPAMKQTERCHPEETRPFTVREYARIQSFPDEWEFFGSVIQQYKQIGNAVPVNMAYRVGTEIVNTLREINGL